MASTINTNIASINAQRNLGLSASSLATSMQRLSSGLRVNSAKDDAAGLAIAERMNTQVRGLTVASRNANDGISLAQTAEGALGKMGDMLQRMRELAVQSSNATNSKADREALQAEVKQLTQEIDRVAKQTTFNGQKILDGSFVGAVFQVGANSGDNVTLGALADTRTSGLASVQYGEFTTAAFDASGATVGTLDSLGALTSGGNFSIQVGTGTAVDLGDLKAASSGAERLGQVVAAINAKSSDTGVTAFVTRDETTGTYTVDLKSSKLGATGAPEAIVFGSAFTLDATGLTAGTDEPVAITAADTGIDTLTVDTQADAWVSLKKIDSAINQINSARADLGALQSRFESAVANIDIQIENVAAARGRIVDADFAKETANLSRTQILQQAGTAMVAQANQLPQNVLKLLQG